MKKLDLAQKLFLGLLLIHLAVNLIWIVLDKQMPAWDQAGHTRLALEFVDKWKSPDAEATQFWQISSYYPPFIHWQVAALMRFFGRNVDLGAVVITIYLILLLIGVYKLSNKMWKNRWVGVIAAMLTGFLPVIYTNSRWFLLDIPLLALVTWSWYFLWQSQFLTKRKETIFFALTVAAVLLTKWTGIVFLLVPTLFVLGKSGQKKSLKRTWLNLLLATVIVLALIAPWYLANYQTLLAQAQVATVGEIDDPQVLWSVENWRFYLWEFLGFQVGLIPGGIILGLMIVYFCQRENRYKKLMAFYLITGYIIFSLLSNKDIRYDLPLLIPVMMMAAAVIARGGKAVKALGAAALIWLIAFYFILSFHLLPTYQYAFNFGPLGWIDVINTGDTVVAYPQEDASANRLILEDLVNLTKGQKAKVLVGIDQAQMSASTLHYLSVKEKINDFTFISVPADLDFNDPQILTSYLDNFMFFIISPEQTGVSASRALTNLQIVQKYLLQNEKLATVVRYASGNGEIILMARKVNP